MFFQLELRPTRINQLFCPTLDHTNYFLHILIILGMTVEFENFSEFIFIFKNNLGYESGDQEGAFDENKQKKKIS
jgi:hypothetical protein